MGDWLDDIARSMARGESRRSVLKKLGGGFLGAALALTLGREALAQQMPPADQRSRARDNESSGPGTEATCKGGKTDCGDRCVDTNKDRNNCGACGNRCPNGTTCRNGSCVCTGNKTACSGVCVDTRKDDDNCGACGNVCTGGTRCDKGTCRCSGGAVECSGVCRNLKEDDNNCGACGNVCTGGSTCNGGRCRCPRSTELCSGTCVDTREDDNNCGECGRQCDPGTQVCRRGRCVAGNPGTTATGSRAYTDRLNESDDLDN